jgi:membrane associated rhomboid family serine protease
MSDSERIQPWRPWEERPAAPPPPRRRAADNLDRLHPFEAILRMVADAEPYPWHPRAYARAAGIDEDALYRPLELLFLERLVQKAPGTPEDGPGVTLTPAGRRVLADPEALRRLIQGRAVVAGDRGGRVREALSRRVQPYATYALIGLNALVFFVAPQALQNGWAVSGERWLRGEWWTVATCCFVHADIMHILFNMFALFQLGRVTEQWWKLPRFLTIYGLAGLGGSCLALAMQPDIPMVGASGAICGLFGAIAVFILANRRHLPRDFVATWRTNLIINGVLLVVISVLPGISYWGHLGGFLVGAATAGVMQEQAFGKSPWRWLVLLLLLPLPFAGFGLIQFQRGRTPEWADVQKTHDLKEAKEKEKEKERENKPDEGDKDKPKDDKKEEKPPEGPQAFDKYWDRITDAQDHAADVQKAASELLHRAPEKRDDARSMTVKKALTGSRKDFDQLAEDMEKQGPYKTEKEEKMRQAALTHIRARLEVLTLMRKRLTEGDEWTKDDQAKFNKMSENWNDLFRLVETPKK